MSARLLQRLTARSVAAALVAFTLVSCEHSPAAPGMLASITVTRNPDTAIVGTMVQFRALGFDANGTPVGISPVWSMGAGGGTISPAGVVSVSAAPGTYTNTVTATVGSLSGRATMVVLSGRAASITLTPTPVTLAIGAPQQFTAVVRDAFGNLTTDQVRWSVAPNAGTITDEGLFVAGTVAGVYPTGATASIGSLSASANITVTAGPMASITVTPNPSVLAINATQQFTAVARDANNNILPFTPTWSIQAGGGTISATGLFTAGTVAGIYANTVRACATAACAAGAIRGFASVTVTAGALASITVTPNPVDVGTNAQQQFTAIGFDANGNVIPILPIPTWSVKAGHAGGTILASGGYTAPAAVGVGFDTVRATSGAITGAARVNVRATTALVAIVVTPNPANLAVNGLQTFTATGLDAAGLIVPTPGLTWAVVNGGGAINPTTGQFTAGTVIGSFPNTIRATSGAISGRATVVISATVVPPGNFLGAAATHGILAGTAVTCAGAPGTIGGDASVWPGTAISGFPPCTITGTRHQGDAYAQTAQGDLTIAYLALAALACDATITADLGGTTLAPGVYCSPSAVGVTGVLTLNGPAGSRFVIRAPTSLTAAGSVVLTGGATADNVFWWTGSSATLGSGSNWQGNILSLTSITLVDGVTMVGRALARNGAVALGVGAMIILP